MRILISYFTGTGNTERLSLLLAKRLEELGCAVDISKIGKDFTPVLSYDALVIAYPVHAFNSPRPVLDFARKLPDAQIPLYIMQVSGEPLSLNKSAVLSLARILRRKGYGIKGYFWYIMPYNIIFRHPDGMASRMLRTADSRINGDARIIFSLSEHRWKVGIIARIVSSALKVEHPAALFIGRGFSVGDSCIGCGLCARVCPIGNIKMEKGRPVFGNDCTICMGCSFNCPEDAIRTGILNGWRVNGPYDFTADEAADEDICRYCRRSYLEYFSK